MRKSIAGLIVILTLPILGHAETTGDGQPQAAAESADAQRDAFAICLRATQRFEQREQTKGSKKPAEAPLSASCKTELKPVAYWQCMDQEAHQDVDFNTAHWRCAKQSNLLK